MGKENEAQKNDFLNTVPLRYKWSKKNMTKTGPFPGVSTLQNESRIEEMKIF